MCAHGAHVEVKGQFCEVGSLLRRLHGFPGLSLVIRVVPQAPLQADSFRPPCPTPSPFPRHASGYPQALQKRRAPGTQNSQVNLTRFIRTLRRSREFRTNGGFLDRVELSLSLRFSCKRETKPGVVTGCSGRFSRSRKGITFLNSSRSLSFLFQAMI